MTKPEVWSSTRPSASSFALIWSIGASAGSVTARAVTNARAKRSMGDLPERYDERSQFTQTSRLELAPDETADSLEVLTSESEKVEADEEGEGAVRGNEGPGSDRETLDLNLGFLVCFPVGKTES